jgi:hypothetical protein
MYNGRDVESQEPYDTSFFFGHESALSAREIILDPVGKHFAFDRIAQLVEEGEQLREIAGAKVSDEYVVSHSD